MIFRALPLLVFAVLLLADARAENRKRVVGATEFVVVEEANLRFHARVDTGAGTSSIHAENIEVLASGDPAGKPISFYLASKDGRRAKIETRVSKAITIRTAEGSERRYAVPLNLVWNGFRKTVLVTLNNRDGMEYRLLLGRNWLRGDFIVDVDRNAGD